jgi:hypothetical protein
MSRKELKEVDPLTQRLDRYMQWIVKNKIKLMVAGAVLAGALVTIAVLEKRGAAEDQAHAEAVSKGMELLASPV